MLAHHSYLVASICDDRILFYIRANESASLEEDTGQ